MDQTRVDSKKLADAIATATTHLAQARQALAPFLIVLSDDERQHVPRARTGFFQALPGLIAAAKENVQVATSSGFDVEAATEDANNVEALAPVVLGAKELAQQLADTSLVWTGEVFSAASTACRVAKALIRTAPTLRTVVDALAPVFEIAHRPKSAPKA